MGRLHKLPRIEANALDDTLHAVIKTTRIEGSVLDIGAEATRLADERYGADRTASMLADALLRLAMTAGIPVKLTSPASPDPGRRSSGGPKGQPIDAQHAEPGYGRLPAKMEAVRLAAIATKEGEVRRHDIFVDADGNARGEQASHGHGSGLWTRLGRYWVT